MPLSRSKSYSLVAVLGTVYSVLCTQSVVAHPLLNRFYERTVDVTLSADPAGEVVVEVKYELEVNQLIALLDAKILLEQRKEEEPGNAKEYYQAFARLHAPLLADRLYATLDGKALDFAWDKPKYRLNPKDGTLHCDFVFRASAKLPAGEKHVLAIEEGAYKEEAGRVLLSLHAEPSLNLLARDEPSGELKARSPADLKIGDDERMRHGALTFTMPTPSAGNRAPADPDLSDKPASPGADASAADEETNSSLLDLLFDTNRGFVVLLALAAVFGAFHALTPGHGKTLVAAYLVGERGTLLHALFLGLVTTLSHTWTVIVLAIVLARFPELVGSTQVLLGLLGGLLVAAMGFWLLYRRLAGQADHFHLAGGHHHDHGSADHFHDEHGHARPVGPQDKVGLWNLVVLGIAGGIVPCWDAIFMLFFAVSRGKLRLALPLLLAFSAGLASVLVVIGMVVVSSKRFAGSHFGQSRLFRALPVLSALLVTGLGLWLCYDAVHGGAARLAGKP
jgi:ABC-type nickel/cobalt efflux system permease component RcnA